MLQNRLHFLRELCYTQLLRLCHQLSQYIALTLCTLKIRVADIAVSCISNCLYAIAMYHAALCRKLMLRRIDIQLTLAHVVDISICDLCLFGRDLQIHAADDIDDIHQRPEVYCNITVYLNTEGIRHRLAEQRTCPVCISRIQLRIANTVDIDIRITHQRNHRYMIFRFINRNKDHRVRITIPCLILTVYSDEQYIVNIII